MRTQRDTHDDMWPLVRANAEIPQEETGDRLILAAESWNTESVRNQLENGRN